MTEPPSSPPKDRTPLWRHVTEAARNGEFRLQQCLECGRVQYPPREVCGGCLSDSLEWRCVEGTGRILSHTRIHMSIEPWFQKHLPVEVAIVNLVAGPVVYVFVDGIDYATNTQVTVEALIDEAGEAVLWARRT